MIKNSTLLIFILSIFLSLTHLSAQPLLGVTLGPDDTLCGANMVNVRSSFIGATGELTDLSSDDIFSGTIDIGFPFTYFGNTYTKCLLSTNGYLSFDIADSNGYSPWAYTTLCPNPALPLNSIFGVYHDLLPTIPGGTISYGIIGNAPNRIFVFNMCNVPMFSCTSLRASHQILLYETSNNIEVHIGNKDLCSAWNSGNGLVGVQNTSGTIGISPPGRNTGPWTTAFEAWQFTPSGGSYTVASVPFAPLPVFTSLNSYFYVDGVYSGSGTSIDVLVSDTTEIIAIVDTNVTSLTCGLSDSIIRSMKTSDTMYLYNAAFDYNASSSVAACLNSNDNAIRLDAIGNIGTGIFNFVWEDTSGIIRNTNRSTTPASDSISGIIAGRYWYTISNGLCSYRDSIQLSSLLYYAGFTHASEPYCLGEVISFSNTSTGSYAYLLYDFGDGTIDSFPNPFHAFSTPGIHTVKLIIYTYTGCTDTESIDLFIGELPTIELGNDTSICDDKNVLLDAGANWDNIIWQDASTNSTYNVTTSGWYKATVSNTCGTKTDSIYVTVEPCDCKLVYPDGFTPNGDNLNETYAPLYICSGLSEFNMRIFNRWGELVYETNDINNGWNGKFKGKEQAIGTYIYYIKAKSANINKTIESNGVFSLIR
jgi:gliding motility-associated-like protein